MSETLHQFLRGSDYGQHLHQTNLVQRKGNRHSWMSNFDIQLSESPERFMVIIDEYANFHWEKRSTIDKGCVFWDCLYILILKRNMPYPFQYGCKLQFLQYVYNRIQSCIQEQWLKDAIVQQLKSKNLKYRLVKLSLFTAAIQSQPIEELINSKDVIIKASLKERRKNNRQIQPKNRKKIQQKKQDHQVKEVVQSISALQVYKEQYKLVKRQNVKTICDKERQRVIRKVTYDLSMVLQSLSTLPSSQKIQGNYYTIINSQTSSSQTIPLWKIIFQCRKAVFDGKVGQHLQLMQKYTHFLKLIYRKQFQQVMLREKYYWQEKERVNTQLKYNKQKDEEEIRVPHTKEKRKGYSKHVIEDKAQDFTSTNCKNKVISNEIYDLPDDNVSESGF